MKKILVTGATGFIGTALCQVLISNDFYVRAVIRRSSQNKYVNAEEVVVIKNIDSDTDWEEALDGISCIVFLSGRVHIMKDTASDSLSEFRKDNTFAPLALAKEALKHGVSRFIYLSSIKVNGEVSGAGLPFSENDKYIPSDPYALSKLEAENALLELVTNESMDVVIIRPPLVYGAGVKANFLSMLKWVARGIPIPLGRINNKRSFISLGNLNDFILTCITHPAASNQVFLVSDDNDMSTTELLRRVGKSLGREAFLIPVDQRLLVLCLNLLGKRDLAQRLCGSLQVDISKAKKLLNWTPPVSIDDALNKTAKYFLEHQS